jgi:hypothetical protein
MERLSCLIEQAEPILQAGLPAVDPLAEASEPFLSPQPVATEGEPAVPTRL